MNAAVHVSIRSNAERGTPLLAMAASSAGTLAGGTRVAIGGRLFEKPSLVRIPISFIGSLSSMMVSSTSSFEPATAWSNLAVRQLYLSGSRWMVPNR